MGSKGLPTKHSNNKEKKLKRKEVSKFKPFLQESEVKQTHFFFRFVSCRICRFLRRRRPWMESSKQLLLINTLFILSHPFTTTTDMVMVKWGVFYFAPFVLYCFNLVIGFFWTYYLMRGFFFLKKNKENK